VESSRNTPELVEDAAVRIALPLLLLAGCFQTGPSGYDGGGSIGFGTPTLQLTVAGVRLGPSAPDPGSGVDVVDEVNPLTGRVTRSMITISASSAAAKASCQLYGERFGDGVLPFFATQYLIEAPTGLATRDGTASPGAGELVTGGTSSFRCTGSGCNGGVLAFTHLSSHHVEGYLSGTFVADTGAGSTNAVCAFWLPTRTFRR
jgi:hypothetical protein